ncbi:MAG: type II secretion system secretin GspD [Candidatus Binatia bacterium]|nr:type II secretion system secretin GspD [Candidatus Binatia bacterium]
MDFQDVELPTLVKFISEITGRNFLMDEKVQGRVSVVSPKEITVKEAYQVFQSVLQVKGFTLVASGPITKIIPIKDAKATHLPLADDGEGNDIFVTQIVPLLHIAADAAAALLQPLVSREGLISAYAPTNSLIVIDTGSNISRLMNIIQQLDVPGQERTVEVIPLHYAFSGELASILLDAVEEDVATTKPRRSGTSAVTNVASGNRRSSTAGKKAALKIVPEERSNSIVVIGSPFQIRQVRALIDKLDVPLPRGSGRIQVYALRHADASELVQVLADLLGISVNTPVRQSLPGRSVTQGGGRFGNDSSSQPFGRSTIGGRNAGSLGGLGGRTPPSAGGRGQGASSAGTGGGPFELEGDVRVTADPATNSLVIAAAPQDYDTLRGVIQQLDVARPQVLVEAIIFEISLNKARELGIELQGGTSVGDGNGVLLGQTNFKNIGALSSALTTGNTAALGAVPGLLGALVSQQVIQLPDGTEVPAGIAMISALEGNSDINVLSSPNILTSDNEEAEIVVGQNVPFVSSRSTNETNLANTFSQIDRRDVGITLRITPQITQGDSVRLFVFQEVSALVPTSEAQVLQLGPTTSLRSTTTTVVVEDGESVAIGGLISDRWTDTQQGVPYLSDIPVLGQLFKFETKTKEKVNLIILLTPRVIQNQKEMRVVADESRLRFRDAVQGREGRFGGTLGSLVPNRLRSLPAEEGGVLLPPVDLGAASREY